MSNNKIVSIPGSNAKFINNEPANEISGGIKRISVTVSREKFPAIAGREKLNSLLLNHCSDTDFAKLLKPEYERLLHTISLETVTAGCEPAVRKKAIWALRHYSSPETTDLLIQLASLGEDEYVRSAAISSLGALNEAALVPILADGLKDKSDMVKTAARLALIGIVSSRGKSVLYPVLKNLKEGVFRKQVEAIIYWRKAERKPPKKAYSAKREKK